MRHFACAHPEMTDLLRPPNRPARRSSVCRAGDLRRLDEQTWTCKFGATKTDASGIRREKPLGGEAVIALQARLEAANLIEGPSSAACFGADALQCQEFDSARFQLRSHLEPTTCAIFGAHSSSNISRLRSIHLEAIVRLIRKILKWLGIGLFTLLVAGAIYQQIGLLLDNQLGPPQSQIVNVEGRAVHVACAGQGPRTYVLDAGAGAGVFEWWRLQPLLLSSGRVCAFDRAGLGWSAAADGGHDGLAAANQLAALVKEAKIPTPFVYVGHSLGANFAMIYFAQYPHDVSALVLIEPGDPKDLLEDFHGTREEAMKAADCDMSCYAVGAATFFGVIRIAALTIGHKTLDERTRSIYQAELARPSNMMTALASLNAVTKTAYENLDIHGFGDTPVLTFASSEPREPEGKETVEDVKNWRVRHFAYLASLAAMSTHGKGPITIPNSTHSSMVLGEPQSAVLAHEIITFTSDLPQ
jgi:pimeloyl-ACP methyl ester carboxylesterase